MKADPGLAGWLRLTLTPGITSSAARRLLAEFGLPERIFALPRSTLSQRLSPQSASALEAGVAEPAVESALAWAAADGHHIVTLADQEYPRALLEIADPPVLLYGVGRVELLQQAALAVVGSRNATVQGEHNAEAFAKSLSDAGFTIASGLALGIDAAAHRGGMAGPSSTIAVLGTGVDVIYPRRNEALAVRIAEAGLLLSELPLGTAPAAYNFPRRNRLISGLSSGCLVVEAAAASGSLITARTAAEQGREVFAIPGSIHSPLSKGCHALIKSGAKLVESADDVLAELSGLGAPVRARPSQRHGGETIAPDGSLLSYMGHDPVDIDGLCERAGLPAEQVASELLRLELDGRVASLPGGLFQRLVKGEVA